MQVPVTDRFSTGRRQRDGGYMLIAILFMLALLVIAATVEAPRLVQQIKRDREEEMIHRGTEYARAIKKFYKKFGRYPANLEQLESTNQIRFLRKRYKDPLTKDGKWKLLNYADIQGVLTNGAGGAPGIPAAALGSQGAQNPGSPSSSFGSSSFGSGTSGTQAVNPNGVFSSGANAGQAGTSGVNVINTGQANQANGAQGSQGQGSSPFTNTFSLGSNNNGSNNNGQATTGDANSGTANPGTATTPGGTANSPFGQNNSANQVFGGGAIVGVASLDKDPTIRIFNKKKTYNEWMFIYDPTQDRNNVLLRGPYQPQVLGGAQGQTTGTPANQLNGQQSPFGQQNNNGFGQGNNGIAQPGGGGFNQPQPPAPSQPQ